MKRITRRSTSASKTRKSKKLEELNRRAREQEENARLERELKQIIEGKNQARLEAEDSLSTLTSSEEEQGEDPFLKEYRLSRRRLDPGVRYEINLSPYMVSSEDSIGEERATNSNIGRVAGEEVGGNPLRIS